MLNRLHVLPSLEEVLVRAGNSKLAHRGITSGKGEQKPTPSALLGKPFLASRSVTRYYVDVTLLSLLDRRTIAKKSNTKFLQLPALIISRSLKRDRASIALAEGTTYRKELIIDQMYFRLPETILDEDASWTEIHRLERQLREIWQSEPNSSLDDEFSEVEAKLDQAVFQLYELSEQEIILVGDTLRHNLNSLIYRKQRRIDTLEAFSEPNPKDLTVYAERIRLQLDGILRLSLSLTFGEQMSSYQNFQMLLLLQKAFQSKKK